MCRYFDPHTFLEELPPYHQLHRPMWAYYELEDGWNVLRRELFGNARPLLQELELWGNQPIMDDELRNLLRYSDLTAQVRHILICLNEDRTALEIAEWYCGWEDTVLALYRCRAEQDMLADMGHIA
jgi:hypothetical protein